MHTARTTGQGASIGQEGIGNVTRPASASALTWPWRHSTPAGDAHCEVVPAFSRDPGRVDSRARSRVGNRHACHRSREHRPSGCAAVEDHRQVDRNRLTADLEYRPRYAVARQLAALNRDATLTERIGRACHAVALRRPEIPLLITPADAAPPTLDSTRLHTHEAESVAPGTRPLSTSRGGREHVLRARYSRQLERASPRPIA